MKNGLLKQLKESKYILLDRQLLVLLNETKKKLNAIVRSCIYDL